MENKIIGNVSDFAIEYGLTSRQEKIAVGYCKLWLNGLPLGDHECPVYLLAVATSLMGVAKRRGQFSDLPPIPASNQELQQLMTGDSVPGIWENYLLPIEGFDDFLKLFFCAGDSLLIVWSLHPLAEGRAEYAFPAGAVQITRLDYAHFAKVCAAFYEAVMQEGEQAGPL